MPCWAGTFLTASAIQMNFTNWNLHWQQGTKTSHLSFSSQFTWSRDYISFADFSSKYKTLHVKIANYFPSVETLFRERSKQGLSIVISSAVRLFFWLPKTLDTAFVERILPLGFTGVQVGETGREWRTSFVLLCNSQWVDETRQMERRCAWWKNLCSLLLPNRTTENAVDPAPDSRKLYHVEEFYAAVRGTRLLKRRVVTSLRSLNRQNLRD